MSGDVVRNDWSRLVVPELAGWRPELTVSVVIPAYNCQPSLDLTLASLSRQTYPAELLEVVVVDDGSEPALRLPELRPAHTRLVRAGDHSAGWGRANALHVGATLSDGDILHWLDADMLVHPGHVAAQARWHHVVPYAVTLGYKRFVDVSPGQVGWPGVHEPAESLFAGLDSQPHDHVEDLIDRTDRLRAGDHLTFMIHVGATAALRRELYEAAGGLDTGLRLGEDTEFGYRLAQAGAVFVPEPAARSWHLGPTHVMRAREKVQRYNRPFLADRMPYPRWLRRGGGTAWSVPLVTAVVDVDGQPLERVRAAVDALLTGTEHDLRVCLVAPWDKLDAGRVPVLSDPLLDLRLVAATYRSEPRVSFVAEAPASVFPSAYLLELPVAHGCAPHALRRLVELADRHQVGLVEVRPTGAVAATRLWRTAALGRAQWVRRAGEPPADAVARVWGRHDADPGVVGVVDLSPLGVPELAAGIAAVTRSGHRPGRWVPNAVEVAGVRSLARATVVVGALLGRRLAARVRRPRRSPDGQPR